MRYLDRLLKTAAAVLAVIMVVCCMEPCCIYAGDDTDSVQWPQPSKEPGGKSAILMEQSTGAVLYGKNVDEQLYPASITKIMTGLLAVERLNMNDTITITDEMLAAIPYDAAIQGVTAGEIITVRDCIYSLMLRSSADMAVALAYAVSGSEEAFAKLMTERAKEMGAVNTNFVNSTGLHDDNHYTSASDMALITKAAMSNPTFAEIFGTGEYDMAATNKEEAFTIWNRHNMLVPGRADYYQYATGGKTGYTDQAQRTLVTCAEKDGLKLIAVIMFSDNESVFSDTKELMNYGFNSFKKITINGSEKRFGQGAGSGFSIINRIYGDSTSLLAIGEGSVVIPEQAELSDMEYRLDMDVKDTGRGEMARLSYVHGEDVLGEAVIYAGELYNSSKPKGSSLKVKEQAAEKKEVQEIFSINIFVIIGIIVAAAVLVFAGRIVARSVKRHRIGKRYYTKRP